MSTITFDFRHYYRKGERRESDQIAYQWDLGHVAEIYVPVNATYEIHYCFADFTETDDYAVESTTAAEDGGYKLTAHIPNKYFERSGELKVYVIGSDDNHVLTTYEGYISIRGRIKPDDYTDDDPENEATRILAEAREARDAAIEAAEQAEAAASQSAAQASIAEVYDATKTYAIGDYCLHDGQLYECTTEITTPEAWTAAHWTATTAGTELNDIKDDVNGLKEELNADISQLKNALDDINSRFDNPNVLIGLVDRTGLAVANGQVINAGSNDAHSIQFDVEPSTQYRIVMPIANRSGFAGNNTGVFEAGQTYTAFSASITYTNSYVFTTPANVTSVLLYFYAGTYTFKRSDFALYKGATIPDDLTVRLKQANLPKQIPYTSVVGVEVTKEETDFIEKIEGVNRFNKEEASSGVMLNANGTTTTLSSQAYAVSGYVPVEAETGYAIYGTSNDAGQYPTDVYVTVQMYDVTKTRLGNAVGTMASGYYTVTTLANTAFMRVNIYNSLDVFMIIKGSTYPATYSPFLDRYVLVGVEASASDSANNPLYGKTILWNGDSICAGKAFNDTDDAWAGRIAEANNMTYKNYAVGGGTITENVQQGGVTKHSVCATLATMYSENPDADYIVFDGGCNDADLLGSMINGNTPERLGTFSLSDFSGNYDEDTFCGAFESIIYRMTNYWRDAKFAYIIPHKMGILNEYRTDYTKVHHNYRAYYDLAIQICEKWGVQYLDLWDKCFFCPMIAHLCDTYSTMTQQEIYDAGMVYADRQHLTQKGYDLEAPMIENWLKTI